MAIPRYKPDIEHRFFGAENFEVPVMTLSDDGDYVEYKHYKVLLAEVENFRAKYDEEAKIPCQFEDK